MKKINLIGYGNWGKKIYPILKNIKNTKINVIKKKDGILNKSSLDMILTNNETHFELVKRSLLKKNNVFCEKPLTTSKLQALKLYKLSSKYKKNILFCDIENFKKKKIKIKKTNNITRTKHSLIKDNILWRLAYHDLSYLYKYIQTKKLTNIQITNNKIGKICFVLIFEDIKFNFYYNFNSRINKHTFNGINLLSSKDYYKGMISEVLLKKVNFYENKKISLFCIKIINNILKIGKID